MLNDVDPSPEEEAAVPEAVIVAASRTPIGRAAKGSLADVRPDDLLAFAIDDVLNKTPAVPRVDVVDVMVGCGFPQEKQGMNLGRRAALLAGLPDTVPGTTVNRFCASSLQTIRMAFHAIRAGEGDCFVAAGVESISQVSGYPKSTDELHPKLFGDDAEIANVYIPMGLTAENVAERWEVGRDLQDKAFDTTSEEVCHPVGDRLRLDVRQRGQGDAVAVPARCSFDTEDTTSRAVESGAHRQHPDHVGPVARQRLRRHVGAVAQFLDRGVDLVPDVRSDVGGVVDHTGDRLLRYPGPLRNVDHDNASSVGTGVRHC